MSSHWGCPIPFPARTRAAPAIRAGRLGGWHTARRALGSRVRNQTCKVSDLFSDGKDFVPQLRVASQKWACRPPPSALPRPCASFRLAPRGCRRNRTASVAGGRACVATLRARLHQCVRWAPSLGGRLRAAIAGRPSRCRTKAFAADNEGLRAKKRLRSFRKTSAVVFVFERSRFRAAAESWQNRRKVAARASRCGPAAGVAEATGVGRRGGRDGRGGQRSLRARRCAPCLR